MKSLRTLDLKRVYESRDPQVNPLRDFYVPALAASTTYDRLTFSFTSGALRAAALGVAGFIENAGLMRLIAAPRLDARDRDMLVNTSTQKIQPEYFESFVIGKIRGMKELANEIDKRYVEALGWMLQEGMLDLRLAIPIDFANEGEGAGIFHTKLGILTDAVGDSISFNGSINETYGGWQRNIERFKVYRSWERGERQDVEFDRETFWNYWNHPSQYGIEFVGFSAAAVEEFTNGNTGRPNLRALKELEAQHTPKIATKTTARDYQVAAVQEWRRNGSRGILSMATGSGKTFTATLALQEIISDGTPTAVFCLVPSASIGSQWIHQFQRSDLPAVDLSAVSDWRRVLERTVFDIVTGVQSSVAVVSVMNRAGSEAFLKQLDLLKRYGVRTVLVADEVHRFGAKRLRAALSETYDFRLGLSATPARYFDDEGTSYLLDYFSGTVFEFSIKDALLWNPPSGQNPILAPFEYRPLFVDLNDEELSEYARLTRRIVYMTQRSQESSDPAKSDELFRLRLARAKIKKTASNKTAVLQRELAQRSDLTHALIYCENQAQMAEVFKVLDSLGISGAPFTQREGTKPEPRFGGLSEREETLRLFRNGEFQVLVSMTLLDEGVDIPEARIGFILASSGNVKEFVQRTGRLIRWHASKTKAEVVDIIVAPDVLVRQHSHRTLSKLEAALIESELHRMEYYGDAAMNQLELQAIVTAIRADVRSRVSLGSESVAHHG